MNLTHSETLEDESQIQDENQPLVSCMTKQFMLVTHVFSRPGGLQADPQSNRMSPQLVFPLSGWWKNNIEAQIVQQ